MTDGSRAAGPPWGAYASMAAGMALFGSATPISKLVGAALPAMLASELRMLTAVAVLAPVLAIRRVSPEHPPPKLSGRDLLLLAGIAVIGTFAFTLLLFYGMREAPGTVGAVVMATTPMVTAVGAVVFLGDRLTRWKLLGLVLAVSGIVVVNLGGAVTDTGDAFLLGSLLVFCAVCCEAAYTLLGKRLTADLSPVAIAVWAAVGAAVLFAPFAVVQGSRFDWSTPSPGEWLAVVWWGAATMGLGSVLWFLGVQKVAATTASGFMAVMPVSALLLAYVLLDERFSWLQPVGMAVVLSGLAAVVYGDAIAGRPAEPRAARGGR